MNLPPVKSTPNTATAAAAKGLCSNCNLNQRWLLHRVLYRGTNRLLCSSCVLRLHPSSFCPTCFDFFENPLSSNSLPSMNRFISCIKCSSLTHLRCIPSSAPPPSSFLCSLCCSADLKLFNPNNAHNVLDKKHTLVFLCAAKIASASVSKALAIARAKADRSVRDSAVARKRAREAVLHVDNLQRLKGSIQVSGSLNLGRNIQKVPANHNVVCKKEELNGQNNNARVSSAVLPLQVPLPQYRTSVTVNNNGAPHSVVRGNVNRNGNVIV